MLYCKGDQDEDVAFILIIAQMITFNGLCSDHMIHIMVSSHDAIAVTIILYVIFVTSKVCKYIHRTLGCTQRVHSSIDMTCLILVTSVYQIRACTLHDP